MPIFGTILQEDKDRLESSGRTFDDTEPREEMMFWDRAVVPPGHYIATIQSAEFRLVTTQKKTIWPVFAIRFTELKPYAHVKVSNKTEIDKELYQKLHEILSVAAGHAGYNLTSTDQIRVSMNLSLFDAQKQEVLTIETQNGTIKNPAWNKLFYLVSAVYKGVDNVPRDRWDINFTPETLEQLIAEELVGHKVHLNIGTTGNQGRKYNKISYISAVSDEMLQYEIPGISTGEDEPEDVTPF